MGKIIIEQDSIFDDFNEHISLAANNRILFSGPFGTGKTTFLKEFFDKHEDRYFTIDLYPIQYSVSQNEDVFELIKFDILLQLIGKYEDKLNLQKEDFSLLLTSQVYIQEHLNVMPLINSILNISQKVGKPAAAIIKTLLDTVTDLKKFQKDIKVDERTAIMAILKNIEAKKGSAYEMDSVSKLISDLVKRIKDYEDSKSGNSQKESVLIIDDLDRLDPEHIFRLFNVFSSQFNITRDGNKFEFDKIIFVCDIDNIRRIYSHKYGPGVDFQGYIDKFYSLNAFDFDNKKFIKRKVGEIIRTFRFSHSRSSQLFTFFINENNYHSVYHVVRWTLLSLIDSSSMNLRMLINPPVNIVLPDSKIDVSDRAMFMSDQFPILGLFYMLKAFYGSFQSVDVKLKELKNNYATGKSQKAHPAERFNRSAISSQLFSLCLPFLLLSEIEDLLGDPIPEKTSFSDDLKCFVTYSVDRISSMEPNKEFRFIKFMDVDGKKEIQVSAYDVLHTTFEKCLKNGFLHE